MLRLGGSEGSIGKGRVGAEGGCKYCGDCGFDDAYKLAGRF